MRHAPPVEWSRQAKTTLTEMTAQAKKPSDGAGPAGTVLRRMRGSFAAMEWLVLGPVSSPLGDKVLEKEAIVGEGAFAPGEGERVGELAWKAAPASGRGVDLAGLFGKLDEDHVAYLCTYFFAPAETLVSIRFEGDHGNAKLWLNGKVESSWELERHHFVKGWNRLLAKVVMRAKNGSSNLQVLLCPTDGPELEYETKNIAWVSEMPGPSYSLPIMVGEKIFVTSEPADLVCVEKRTGKMLWVESETLWHGAVGERAAGWARHAVHWMYS